MNALEFIETLPFVDASKAEEALGLAYREAQRMGLLDSLEGCLERLNAIGKNRGGKIILWPDFAPLSLSWWLHIEGHIGATLAGGLIFHGQHDGYGSGSAPTYSTTLSSTNGWSLHT